MKKVGNNVRHPKLKKPLAYEILGRVMSFASMRELRSSFEFASELHPSFQEKFIVREWRVY